MPLFFISCLNGLTQLQILAAEEIRTEALRSYVSALQDYVPEQQMRAFLTIFLLRNLPAYSVRFSKSLPHT